MMASLSPHTGMALRRFCLFLKPLALATILLFAFLAAVSPLRADTRARPPRPFPGVATLRDLSDHASNAITVSGVVSGPNGPVPDVWVGVGSPLDWKETRTDANGFYSVSIQTQGYVWFNVRPDVATRLAQINLLVGEISADFTQNFTVTAGNLLTLQVMGEGAAVNDHVELTVEPLINRLIHTELFNQWYSLDWDETTQRHQAVLPPHVYYVTVERPPAPYYQTVRSFDLRAGDLNTNLPLNTTYVHPIPYNPPDASKITIGPPDGLGEAEVRGAAGAALPLAHVLLVNLNSTHQAHAISEADGSFSARIYAPPGSAIMIKHGPAAAGRWDALDVGVSEGVNPFPGVIIHVPFTHTAQANELPFAAVGGVDVHVDDPPSTRNYVGAAWAITGTLAPLRVEGAWTRVITGVYEGETTPGLYLGGLNWTHPALADLDNDADLDLLVGERSGRLILYRNQGDAAAADWRFETADYAGVSTGGWAYPALADVTDDDAPDLFVGAGDGRVLIYYNTGTPAAPAWPETPDVTLHVGDQAAPTLTDLNHDGRLDLLVGYQGGTLYYFQNTGAAAKPVWTLRTDNYANIHEEDGGVQPAFVDLDDDGDLDLLIGLCGQVIWYERSGSAANPTWTRRTDDPINFGGGSCGVSPGVGDWDNDGDDDVITGEHWGDLRLFRHDPPSGWTEQDLSMPFELAGDTAPALADWDNDGDLDLLIGQVHGALYKYTNVGSTSNPDWRDDGEWLTLPWTNHPHPFPAFADIDGDHDYDLFIGEGSWEGPEAGGNIRFYRNEGTPESPNWSLVTEKWLDLDVGGWSAPTFVDIDNDGDLDLFVGSAQGMITFVENTGTATSPSWAAAKPLDEEIEFGPYSAPAFVDVDQDGDYDLLVGREDGRITYVRNIGSASVPVWRFVTADYLNATVGALARPVAADIDGDGNADLFIGDGDGGLNLYLYAGPKPPNPAGGEYAPGEQVQVRGVIRLYSPAINAATNTDAIAIRGGAYAMMLFDEQGRPLAAENYFMSTMLTPTGFPIQRPERPTVDWAEVQLRVEGLRYVGGHALEGEFTVTGRLPENMPPGIYRPGFVIDVTGAPTSTAWLAANVVNHTFGTSEVLLPPITVGRMEGSPHLIWRLLADDFVQGTRGAAAREDRGIFEMASQIVSQGAPYYAPPVDMRTGQPITYRLEPYLPMISYTDRRLPTPPLLPFDLPGGRLCVTIQEPNDHVRDLGCEPFAQSFHRTKTTRGGLDLNTGTVQLDDVYSLATASRRFRIAFEQYGHHVITMTGVISDVWGNRYNGGGTYDVWMAQPLDIDPGVLPGAPLAVGDAFNPAIQFLPRVPADVSLTLTLYPNSDPARAVTQTITGRTNDFGYFDGRQPQGAAHALSAPITLDEPGEYRLDLTATYTDANGALYMGAMTWGGVVMTPENEADLIAHGRRGLDSLTYIPNHWFVSSRDLTIPPGAVSHSYNPYFNGDMLWTRMSDGPYGGDSLLIGASVQDTVGVIKTAIRARAARGHVSITPPGSLDERFDKGEIPLFISTRSGLPAQIVLGSLVTGVPDDVDQIAYSYRSSQRPGVRVREIVSEDGQNGGYWRLNTLYDDQLGVGILGDQPNDFKFQYVGAVYRDLDTGHNEYLGQGTGWVFIPDDDPTGSRVMPPFAGPGNGGWTTEGGPILTLKGQDIHIFILPTGVRPGAVLELGDMFRFAGHLMPTLDSQVAVTVTAPSGAKHLVRGQANRVGYFYNPDDDFIVDEPGL
ncbi:MAG: VCBS repeat-containing protein, partial [Chloroflexi bacterium]|nr:VCBS repeat-containing protein [Chloroflexota bacterium]